MCSGAWMLDTFMRIAPTKILLDRALSHATWAIYWLDGAFGTCLHPTRDSASLHPCSQAAYFLPCTRPTDISSFRVHARLTHAVLASTDLAIVGPKASATVPKLETL